MAKISVELPDDQAFALARLCEKISYTELRNVARNDAEIGKMDKATWTLRQSLAAAGFECGRLCEESNR